MDSQPHVLTLFAFTTQAKFAYRAIASFIKHVTGAPTAYIDPFPTHRNQRPVAQAPSELSGSGISADAVGTVADGQNNEPHDVDSAKRTLGKLQLSDLQGNGGADQLADSPIAVSGNSSRRSSGPDPLPASGESNSHTHRSAHEEKQARKRSEQEEKRRKVSMGVSNEYSGAVPLLRPSFHEYMIRERVDVRGQIRPMEPEHEMQALQLPPEEMGTFKEGPVSRYLTGQALWAKRFHKEEKRVAKRRAKNEAKAEQILRRAAERGLLGPGGARGAAEPYDSGSKSTWTETARIGPTDLAGETPPPSAIAGRRDTEESLALLRTSLRLRAKHAGRMDAKGRAEDAAGGAPEQSAAEKQRRSTGRLGGGGVAVWSSAMSFLYRKQPPRDPTAPAHVRRKSASRREGDDEDWEDENHHA